MQVQLETPKQAVVIALIAELDAYQDSLYPPEARYALDLTALEQDNVLFAVARNADGHAMGCGAVVLDGDAGELKRMFVHPTARAQGVAAQVLAKLSMAQSYRGQARRKAPSVRYCTAWLA
ncbi:GNAT family N-acetyltransferase [Rhodoferax aquaticus]|uniref:GNAT family N-acetyltransferase n=1 Tax=Rhodoferax aquaticus TaxID=2527691 RepID=A0A515ETZ4_9BURK|nr:GNAT family N-acetyltransferase [Rhodoferax aquaticus]QDL56121.1 GNAT family N-acetyltransferase [Rhodoferax aquaticus]